MGPRQSEDDLIFDVRMALRGAPFVKVKRGDDLGIVAAKIVAHLKLCGWRFERRERNELHG